MSETEKKRTLEEDFAELDSILKQMENKELPLEESFRLYERGVSLLKEANASIDRVEKKVQKLNADGSMEPLDNPADSETE